MATTTGLRQAFEKGALIKLVTKEYGIRRKAADARVAERKARAKVAHITVADFMGLMANRLRRKSVAMTVKWGGNGVIIEPKTRATGGIESRRRNHSGRTFTIEFVGFDNMPDLGWGDPWNDELGDLDQVLRWINGFRKDEVSLTSEELDRLCSGRDARY